MYNDSINLILRCLTLFFPCVQGRIKIVVAIMRSNKNYNICIISRICSVTFGNIEYNKNQNINKFVVYLYTSNKRVRKCTMNAKTKCITPGTNSQILNIQNHIFDVRVYICSICKCQMEPFYCCILQVKYKTCK